MENLTSQQVIFLVCLIISLVLTFVSLAMHFYFKKRENKVVFKTQNYDGIWSFIKRNFWIYSGIVCFVMMISFLTFLIF